MAAKCNGAGEMPNNRSPVEGNSMIIFTRYVRAFMLLCVVLLGACGALYAFHGTVLEPLSAAPDFTLTDQNGQPFRLSD